jgi:hypothetical protein
VLAGSTTLPEALAGSAHKGLAKAAKKALYRLRSQGIEPARPPAPAATPAPGVAGLELLPSVLTCLDVNTGERILELGRPLRGGGVEALQLLLSDERGVVRLDVAETSRSQYRRMVKRGTGPGPEGAVEIPQAEALERLAAAAGLNLRSRTAFPQGLDGVLRHLGVQPRDVPLELPPPEPEDERLAREAHTLHAEPELQDWLPPVGELRKLAFKVDEVEASPLALTPVQRDEQLIQAARGLAHAFFAPEEVRRLYAGRLWEMALHLERLGRSHPAQVARAEARRLFHGPAEPPSRFAERLYEKALLLTLTERVAPSHRDRAPARTEQSPTAPEPPERRSPGGIILP